MAASSGTLIYFQGPEPSREAAHKLSELWETSKGSTVPDWYATGLSQAFFDLAASLHLNLRGPTDRLDWRIDLIEPLSTGPRLG